MDFNIFGFVWWQKLRVQLWAWVGHVIILDRTLVSGRTTGRTRHVSRRSSRTCPAAPVRCPPVVTVLYTVLDPEELPGVGGEMRGKVFRGCGRL